MNPIKNKKDLETTIDELRNFAYDYIARYSCSKQQLRTFLFKKYLKKKQKIYNKKELFNLIDTVISTLENQKLFFDSTINSLTILIITSSLSLPTTFLFNMGPLFIRAIFPIIGNFLIIYLIECSNGIFSY